MEKREGETEKNSAAVYYKLLRHSYNVTAQFRIQHDIIVISPFVAAILDASRAEFREWIDIRECAEFARNAFRVNAKRGRVAFNDITAESLLSLLIRFVSPPFTPETQRHASIDIRYKGHAFVHGNMNTRLPDRRQNRHKSRGLDARRPLSPARSRAS